MADRITFAGVLALVMALAGLAAASPFQEQRGTLEPIQLNQTLNETLDQLNQTMNQTNMTNQTMNETNESGNMTNQTTTEPLQS